MKNLHTDKLAGAEKVKNTSYKSMKAQTNRTYQLYLPLSPPPGQDVELGTDIMHCT